MNLKFSIVFDDIAEGRVRCFHDSRCTDEVHFETYGQAMRTIEQLRNEGYAPLSPSVEAIETLLSTAELYQQKVTKHE